MTDVVTAPLPARPEYITAQARSARVRCSESFYPPRLAVKEHLHDKATITLIIDGSFEESKGTARARCERGAAIIRCAGEPHANLLGSQGALNLELELSAALAAECELERADASMVFHPAIATLAARMRVDLRIDDRAQPLLLEGLALEIAGNVLREGRADRSHRPPPWLERVRERLEASFLEDVSPTQLAREAGVHPVSLARAFRQHFGSSPGTFLRLQRVAWAARELLRDPIAQVTEIALAAGFYDQSHFARVFKAQLGLAPGAYRRARR